MRIIRKMGVAIVIVGLFAALMLLASSYSASNNIKDRIDDAVAVRVHETNAHLLVQPYHDIVGAGVQRLNSDELLLTVELNGDPNFNTTYEVVYIWEIQYPTVMGNQRYTVIIPHFPQNFGLSTGWHIAIFDNKAERYVVPLKSIGSMTNNKVEVNIDPSLIGNPAFFWWQTFVMVRVEPEFGRSPDFLMDSAPDNSTLFFWLVT